MKILTIFWLAVGLSITIISPSLTQIVTDNNLQLLQSSTIKTGDLIISNSGDEEQLRDETTVPIEPIEDKNIPKFEEEVNIIIEESKPENNVDIELTTDNPLALSDASILNFDNELVPMRDEDFYYNDLINRDPNEIMDAAAGFVPIPIFRKKHKTTKPQKPYASRRYYRRPYGYRRYYYFYPYYGYYPSSLRYY